MVYPQVLLNAMDNLVYIEQVICDFPSSSRGEPSILKEYEHLLRFRVEFGDEYQNLGKHLLFPSRGFIIWELARSLLVRCHAYSDVVIMELLLVGAPGVWILEEHSSY